MGAYLCKSFMLFFSPPLPLPMGSITPEGVSHITRLMNSSCSQTNGFFLACAKEELKKKKGREEEKPKLVQGLVEYYWKLISKKNIKSIYKNIEHGDLRDLGCAH
jgi:hypothetical protein